MTFPLHPDQASSIAGRVDALYFFLVALSAFFVAIIFLPMCYFLWRYRRGVRANRVPFRFATWKIEVVWSVIPLLLAMGIFGWAAHVYFTMQMAPADALEINVIGKQWMWKIQHEEGNREINELHVPVGRTIKLTMASEDVIHSFFIPAFRVKQDVVPGRFTTLWFQPTEVGVYHLFCAEYCGTDHSRMVGRVYVMEQSEYQEWLVRGDAGGTLAQAGARLFLDLGCSGCHVGSSVVRAPQLDGIYGKPVPLQSGEIVVADDRYLRDSILLPSSEVTAGYEDVMPSYQGRITEEELFELIAYLKSLRATNPGGAP